ncbi:MAG: glycosyltransferase, partial [Candidatus Omnitrophica bacterium]|nr:glycosyltransferase [Candidatus Omnitrophota bacterium]
MPKTLLTISVVIGSNESLIIPCLASICQGTKSKFDIYVVSNQSSAEIVNEIKRQFPAVNIVLNSSCKGFAENHNYVMECSDSEYVLILNDDTLLPDGSIDKLTEFMEKNKKIGVVSPKLINPDGSLQPSTYRFPNLITIFLGLSGLRSSIHPTETVLRLVNLVEKSFGLKGKSRLWKHDYTTEVDTFKGACTLVRRKAINEVGLMDEVTLF